MIDALGEPQSLLVLGGTSDIALATARRWTGRRLERVVLAGRDETALDASAQPLRAAGVKVDVERFDARDTASHPDWVREVWDRHRGFDVVLLAFGVLGDQDVDERDPASAVAVVEANYVGAVSTGLAVGHELRTQGHGVLVVLSSVAGVRARRANFVYGSSKAALDAFATGLREMVRPSARVLVVRPGFVQTKMTAHMQAKAFATTAEAVADGIAAGVAGNAEVVYVPSALKWVFGILRLLPNAVFRRLPLG